MIILVSENKHPWLKYIWEEFVRIQGLKEESLFLTQAEYRARSNGDAKLVVESNDQPQIAGSLFIGDLLHRAFLSLSRFDEWLSEAQGHLIHSYASKHPNKKRDWKEPAVNYLFQELEDKILQKAPQVVFTESQKPIIEFSHDIDYIKKTIQLRLKQTAFNLYKTVRHFPSIPRMSTQAGRMLKFLFSNPSYWCFEDWRALEKKYNHRSVFYIYARTGCRCSKSWLLDPSYDIAHNQKLQDQLKSLMADGFEVGLHGSIKSAFDANQLAAEKEAFEKALGISVTKTRQHWLNYRESITPQLHDTLFKYDSTVGWNDQMGFRAGCASRYRPYDHVNQRSFNYFETPLVLMDSTIYDYHSSRIPDAEADAALMLNKIRSLKNAHVSVCWHQRVLCGDYGWGGFYKKIVDQGGAC